MKRDPRYQVEDPEIQVLLQSLAETIAKPMPEGWGFTLFLFSYGEDGALFYISSAQRVDMLATIREFLHRNAAQ